MLLLIQQFAAVRAVLPMILVLSPLYQVIQIWNIMKSHLRLNRPHRFNRLMVAHFIRVVGLKNERNVLKLDLSCKVCCLPPWLPVIWLLSLENKKLNAFANSLIKSMCEDKSIQAYEI